MRGALAALRRHERGLLLAAGLVVLALVVAPPLVGAIAGLARAADPAGALRSPRTWALLFRSLGLAGAVTVGALAFGVPLGVLVGRTDVAGRRALWLLHAFPAFLPPFLLALGWFHVFGVNGAMGTEATSRLLFSAPGAIAVLTFALAPIVTCLVALAAANVDASQIDAGRAFAPPLRVARVVLARAASPAAGLGAALVFTLAFSELGVPTFLRVDAYPLAVLVRLAGTAFAPEEAAALALPLVAVAGALFVAQRALARRAALSLSMLRLAGPHRLLLGRARLGASVLAWAVAILGLVPVLALAVAALPGFLRVREWMGDAPVNSLASAAGAATVITVAGALVGHAAARGQRGTGLADLAAVFAFTLPAPLLALGVVAAFDNATFQFVYASILVLIVGLAARYSVIGMRASALVFATAPRSLEDAAAVFSVSPARALLRVALPVHGRALALVWLVVFVFAMRDLESTIFFHPPGLEPLLVRVFTLEANGPAPVVAALAMLQVGTTAAAVAAGGWLATRSP